MSLAARSSSICGLLCPASFKQLPFVNYKSGRESTLDCGLVPSLQYLHYPVLEATMTTTISGINQMAVQMDCMSMSKYEFLQELRPAREVEGMQPSYLREPRIENTKLAADEQALVGTEHANGAVKTVKQTTTIPPQQWMVRRRRDEKVSKT